MSGTKIPIGNVNGKSAYDHAVDGGYTGTEAQFDTLLARAVSETIATATVVDGDLVVTTVAGEQQNLGRVVGQDGQDGEPGLDGANVLPTNEAVAQAVTQDGPTKDALSLTIGEQIEDVDTPARQAVDARAVDIARSIESAVGQRRAVADVVNGRVPSGMSGDLPAIAAAPNARKYGLGAVAAILQAGGGYVVGEILTIGGGTSSAAALVRVTSVSSGAITGVAVLSAGVYSATPANPASQSASTGAGQGAFFTLQWSGRPSALRTDESTSYTANGGVLRFTGNGPGNIASTGAYGNTVGNSTAWFFDFETDATTIEIVLLAFNSEYTIFVDDRRIGLDKLETDSSGGWIVAQMTYSVSRKRRVRVFAGKNGALHTVRIANAGGRTVTAPTVDRMLVWGLGDSYMFGTQARALSASSFMTMCAELGVDGLPDGIGGAGWRGSSGGSAIERVNAKLAALTRTPDIIVWDLGYNERSASTSEVVAAMEATIARARELVPNAQHVAFSPATPLGETAQLLALKLAMAASLAEMGVHMVDQSNWITARTRALYTSSDNDHPTPAGHDLIGARKAASVRPYLAIRD